MDLFKLHRFYGYFILFIFPNAVVSKGVPCIKKDGLCGCVFKNENGEDTKLSMSAFDNKNGTPFFQRIEGPKRKWIYYLNLCTGFSLKEPRGCSDVTGCQVDVHGIPRAFVTGKPGTEVFGNYTVNEPFLVKYKAVNQNIKRFMTIRLICQEKAETPAAKFTKEIDDREGDHYVFDVESKHICLGERPSSTYLSIGSIIVIGFVGFVFTYFASGMLFMKFGRGATGKEIIPNVNFWSSLPGYIKDGCVFFAMKTSQLCQSNRYATI